MNFHCLNKFYDPGAITKQRLIVPPYICKKLLILLKSYMAVGSYILIFPVKIYSALVVNWLIFPPIPKWYPNKTFIVTFKLKNVCVGYNSKALIPYYSFSSFGQ